MAYTYNDVQSATATNAVDDASSVTTDNSVDRNRWMAVQQAYMASAAAPAANSGTEPAASGADQSIAFISTVGRAATRLSTAQSVANVQVMNDSFIRDNITGK